MPMVKVDIHTHRQFAVMTAVIIGLLVAASLHVLSLGDAAGPFLHAYGAEPRRLLALIHWRHPYNTLYAAAAIVSSLFLHGNWAQLVVNVVLLLLYGSSVEDRVSHTRFLGLFVLGGAVGVLAQSFAAPDSPVALIGAEGGVSAVAGACLSLAPRGQVPTMIRGFEFPWIFGPVAWLLAMLLLSVAPLPMPPDCSGVGLPYLVLCFVSGALLGPLFLSNRPILLRG
jgi:membrane associated rhomboid family serine protease